MRAFVTSLAFVAFVSTLAATIPARAGTVVNEGGKFSFWVPDDMKETKDSPNPQRSTFENADGSIYVLVGPLAEEDADLIDEDVLDFVDEELDGMKATSDKNDTVEKFKVRLVEGTGVDEGDPVDFKMLALDPGTDDTVLAVLVYGDPSQMNKAENQSIVERILRSLRPH